MNEEPENKNGKEEKDDFSGDLRKLDDDALWDLAEKFANDWVDNYVEEMWSKEKEELKILSKKELAKEMLFRGSAESFFVFIKNAQQFQIDNPPEDESLWEEGGYAKKVSPEEMESKMRTFSMGHDEEMNFNCKNCNVKISAHNKDWHEELCDSCFDKQYHDGGMHIDGE